MGEPARAMLPGVVHPAAAPNLIDLSCPDWEDRIRNGRSLIPDAARGINPAEYDRAVAIYNKLILPDVVDPETGQPPTLAKASGEWFREIVGVLLGAVVISGLGVIERLIRELFLLAPKKSSKTSYGAALMLCALLMNRRPRAEFLLIAPTRDIAELAFAQAAGMCEGDPDGFLQKRMHVRDHKKMIVDRRTRAHLQIKSFDPSVLTGVKPLGVLLDELHEIAKNAKAAKIIGQIRGGLLPFPEAFLAIITTQSDEPPAGAFLAELRLARAIRDGRAQGQMMPVLYEFPRDIQLDHGHFPDKPAAWMDPSIWHLVTPNIDRSITIPRLISDFQQAREKGADEIQRWASQHLNIEIGLALHSQRWEGADYWDAAADPKLTLASLIERCEVIVVGIDGGGLDDLLALCIMGRERGTGIWLTWHKTWVHESVLKLRQEIAPRLLDFQRLGELVVVKNMPDAFDEMASYVEQVSDEGLLPESNAIGLDPVGVGLIVKALAEVDIATEELCAAIPQGWKLNGAIKTAAVKLASGELVHGGQEITRWAAGNAKTEPKGNAITITKQAAGTAKIDPLMALFDATALMSMNPPAADIYGDGREIIMV